MSGSALQALRAQGNETNSVMHILHIIDALGLGGAERMLVDIANATVRRGLRVSVCVTRSDSTLAAGLDEKIAVHVLNRRRRLAPGAARRLARLIRAEGVDVVHTHSRSTFSMLALLKGVGLVRRPILMHDHFGGIEIDATISRRFRHLGRRFVGHYVGVSGRLAEWAGQAGVPLTRISVVPNALELGRIEGAEALALREELAVPADTLLGVAVGNIRYEKGTDLLIDAVKACRVARSCLVLIVGSDADAEFGRRCREQVRMHGLERRIRFLGARSDTPGLLKSVDFAVSAARSESGPLVLIEYLAAGLPIVATSAGDIGAQLAASGLEGMVTPGDVEAFTAELDRLLSTGAAEWAVRSKRVRQAAAADFHIDRVIDRWLDIYRGLAGAGAPSERPR